MFFLLGGGSIFIDECFFFVAWLPGYFAKLTVFVVSKPVAIENLISRNLKTWRGKPCELMSRGKI